MTGITYRDDRDCPLDPLVALYRANAWSSAEKGEARAMWIYAGGEH
jgi:hypothetical protein